MELGVISLSDLSRPTRKRVGRSRRSTGSRWYAAGDLSYWSPSGKLAIVYDALGQSVPPPGLVRLGTVEVGLNAIASAGSRFTMTIRQAR